jgi:hypothetical protein
MPDVQARVEQCHMYKHGEPSNAAYVQAIKPVLVRIVVHYIATTCFVLSINLDNIIDKLIVFPVHQQ